MSDDADLLRRYLHERSEAAFSELVHRHLDGIYSSVLRRVGGDAHLAQDVAQRVFTALARKAAALGDHPYLTGWLYAAARVEAANVVRGEQRRKVREQEAHAMTESLSASAPLDWSRLAPVLDEAIDELGEADRQAVLQRFVDRKRYPEIGAALQLTENAARMRTQRALEQLREILRRRGLVSTGAAIEALLAENAVAAAPAGVASAVTQAALTGGASGLGAAAVGASLLGLLASPTVLAFAVLALTGGFAVTEFRQESRQAALVAQSRAELGMLNARLSADQKRLAADTARSRTRAAARTLAAPLPDPQQEAHARGAAFLARHPEVRDALDAYYDAATRTHFAALYRELALSPAQIRRFEIDRRAGNGFGREIQEGEIELDPSDGLTFSQADADIHALLGDGGYARYLDFLGSQQGREVAAELAGATAPTDSPLSPAQLEQIKVLFAQGARPGPNDWNTLVSKAAAVLSPAQLSILNDLRAADELQRGQQ